MSLIEVSGNHRVAKVPNVLKDYIVLIESLCVCLTGAFLIVRCSVRLKLMKKWNMEDWLCIISWLAFLSYGAVLAYAVDRGAGAHQSDLDGETVKTVLFLTNTEEIVYSFSILFIKITLLYVYLRLFSFRRHSKRWWIIIINMVLNVLFYTGLTLAKAFRCSPREAIWDSGVLSAACGSLAGVLLASGTWNTLSDLIIFSMPMVFLWRMPNLNKETRRAVVAIFAIGCIAPVFSILGVAMRVRFSADVDQSYYQWRIVLFAYAELTTGMICACVPVIPRLLKSGRGQRPTFHDTMMNTHWRRWPGHRWPVQAAAPRGQQARLFSASTTDMGYEEADTVRI